jgi:beta-glucosidase
VKYSEGQVEYVLGSSLFEQVDIQKAVNAARKSNVIVVCLGEIPSTEKPGDIDDLNLPASQRELVKELSKLGKPMVFALVFNRPMIIREIEPLANAILQCYLPGDYGGEAFARILYGEVNPSGKLPFTYPRHTGTFVPYDHKYTETLDKNFGRNAFNPQWEFGFGLSYSQFEYSNLKLDSETFAKDGQIQVSFTVANASDSPGKEVVQVYVTDMVASISPSVKRLRAFDKIAIGARDSVEVSMSIPVNELSFVGKENLWVIQEGEFVLSVANNSVTFEVK